MILDSCFLIDLLRNSTGAAVNKAEELDSRFGTKSISVVSVMELWRGTLRGTDSQSEIKKVNSLLDSCIVLPLGIAEAKKAAEIEVDLLHQGEMIDWEDILIAATSLIHNKIILTRNKKHFLRINGVKVETY